MIKSTMRTEKEIREIIKQITDEYHKEIRQTPQWIASTYFIDALLWVLGDVKGLPPILLFQSSKDQKENP